MTQKRPASQKLSPRSAILVGQREEWEWDPENEREKESKSGSPSKGLGQASGVVSHNQAHFLQRSDPKSELGRRMEDSLGLPRPQTRRETTALGQHM